MTDTNDGLQNPSEEPITSEVVEAEILDEPDELDLPEDPAEAVPVLMTELMAARAKSAEATDLWKRSVAEFDNYRKRALRDQQELVARAAERVVIDLLPVLDSLDAAMDLEAETDNESKMLSGMSGTRELLLNALAREGVEPIESVGAPFDPAVHEAVQVGEGDGTLIVEAELRRGYLLNGKVLRASLVSVGYGTDAGNHEDA